jgi:hypothetical protein
MVQKIQKECEDLKDDPKNGSLSTAQNLDTVEYICALVARDHYINLNLTQIKSTLTDSSDSSLTFFSDISKFAWISTR